MGRFVIALAAFTFVTGAASAQHAENDSSPGEVKVISGWARATPGPMKVGAAYFVISNNRDSADRLVSVSSPVAGRAQQHRHEMDNGVMRMRQVKDGVTVPAHDTVTFRPGGHHVMLLDLKEKLVEGRSFPLSLTFEESGTITITVQVLGVGAMGPGGAHDRPGHRMETPHGHGN